MRNAARLQEQEAEFQYRAALKQQDVAIDLQMNERAKLWEIEKMELRSRGDFAREEQARQRKLDSYDNALQQIDKEVLAGRMTEQEAYPLRLKYEMNKVGVDAPTSLLPAGGEDERYGVQPYWMRGRVAPEGTSERQLYEAKMAQQISGERRGTVPYYLDPTFVGGNPEAARQAQEARGIFLSDEEFESIRAGAAELPLVGKQLDVGVRTKEGVAPVGEGRIRVISPEGQTGTILESDLGLPEYKDFTVIGGEAEGTPETVLPPTTEDVVRQLEAGEAKFYKPSLRTFATMSPLRLLMERRKAKKLVK